MMNTQKTLVCLAVLLVTAGCHSTSAQRSLRDDSRAVVCSKCKMVWVERYDMNDPYMMTLVSEEVMQCPDCESAVATFFRTGKFEHSCATCGDALWHCEHE